ncbi:flavin monoamine oxidase family protein [Clostridium cellulovorans]|uniref:Amine oxidase n=1 Tax=Clostridium cellulovorans (strain ATCC 35296 / DSM 3052 / OCM 3 / 743B) TaxID=573061 RepID=D9SUP5_CLOC7|nr:FAD-dependent oxidoreductase [Clostridium cellulovorans]ADL50950.1 amine oxidase [Clostridium cellulovorans 743B]
MDTDKKFKQPNNPTDEERHRMMKIALEEANHPEDYENLLELLNPPKDITTIVEPDRCEGIKIGIIGGGLAGLSSAFELRKLGFDITIFETEDRRIGGRVYTHYFDRDKKLYGELGAMRIPASHGTTWHYINLFGLDTIPFVQNNENTLIYIRGKHARNDPQGLSVMKNIYPEFNLTEMERSSPWQKIVGNALATPFLKVDPELRKELLQNKEHYSTPIRALGSYSIREVMKKMGVSEGAIEMISGIIPFLGAFYNNSYSENMQEEYTVDSAFRYAIVGGAVNLPLAFYRSLMSKTPKEYSELKNKNIKRVSWRCGKTVTGIYKEDIGNKVTLKYIDERSAEVGKQIFDFVICTIPFSSLRNVEVKPYFTPEKMQSIKEVYYVSSQKTVFMCNERFWEVGDAKNRIVGGGSSTDLPIQTIWYPCCPSVDSNIVLNNKRVVSKKHSFYDAGVLLASYNLGQDALRLGNLPEKTRIENIKRQVELVHRLKPGYLDSVVDDYKSVLWDSEKGFYGGFCYFMPEQQQLFSAAMIKPEYDNRVYFAGEHIGLAHGWIEASVNTGMKAANAIAEYCKNILVSHDDI